MRLLKVGNILIPKIKEKIKKKQKELNLKPIISPAGFLKIHKTGKHRYFSPCLTNKGKKVVFFARLHNNLDAKIKFKTDIEFLEKIRKKNFKIKKFVPELINFGIEKDFEWLVRKYPEEPPLGTSRNISREITQKTIEKIAKIVFEISKISPQKLSIKLRKFDFKNYLPLKTYLKLVEENLISKETAENIGKMIKKNFPLLKKENSYFSHGDLNLGNILSDGKNFWVIDWELIRLNNFAYDIGYLWAHLWEAKREIRKKLMENYIKNLNSEKLEKFKKLLPIVASYISLGGILTKKKGESFTKRRKFYKNLLENCLDFDKLIKV